MGFDVRLLENDNVGFTADELAASEWETVSVRLTRAEAFELGTQLVDAVTHGGMQRVRAYLERDLALLVEAGCGDGEGAAEVRHLLQSLNQGSAT